MRFLSALLGLASFFSVFFAGLMMFSSIVPMLGETVLPVVRRVRPPARTPPPIRAQLPAAGDAQPHVVCVGCEDAPRVAISHATPVLAGKIAQQLSYTPNAYVSLGGRVGYPHELVHDILTQQKLGHIVFKISVPEVRYAISGAAVREGAYRVRPRDVSLENTATVRADFTIRYPTLTNEQFTFLRDRGDYRFVYGLVRGVIRHEERHFRALNNYLHELRAILAAPLTNDLVLPVRQAGALEWEAQQELLRVLRRRIAAVQEAHERAQAAIDDPVKKAKVDFVFEEEVEGEVPPMIIAEFIGEADFSFVLPPGPIPRLPAPTLPK